MAYQRASTQETADVTVKWPGKQFDGQYGAFIAATFVDETGEEYKVNTNKLDTDEARALLGLRRGQQATLSQKTVKGKNYWQLEEVLDGSGQGSAHPTPTGNAGSRGDSNGHRALGVATDPDLMPVEQLTELAARRASVMAYVYGKLADHYGESVPAEQITTQAVTVYISLFSKR